MLSINLQKNSILSIQKTNIFIGLFFLMMVTFTYFTVPNYSFIILSFFSIVFLILKKNEYIYIIASIIPFSTGIPYPQILTIGLVIYILKYYKKAKLTPNIILILFFLSWELIHFLNTNFIFNDYISFAVIMIWFGIIIFDKKNLKTIRKKQVVYSFSLSTVILGIILIYQSSAITSLYYLLNKGIRLGSLDILDTVIKINPNAIALYSICSIAMVLSFRNFKDNFTFNILLIVALLGIGLLTYSRMFIIAIIFILLLLFLLSYKNIKIVMITFLFALIFLFFINNIFPEISDNIFVRFDVVDLSNGRTNISQEYNEYLSSNTLSLLFGVGMQDYRNKTDISESVHNPIQEVVVIWGLVGLIAVLYLLFYSLKVIVKEEQHGRFISYLPLITFAISIQTSRIFTTSINVLLMLIVFISSKGDYNDETSV